MADQRRGRERGDRSGYGWAWGATVGLIEFQIYGIATRGGQAFLDGFSQSAEQKEDAVELPGAIESGRKADVKRAQTDVYINGAVLDEGGEIDAATVTQVESNCRSDLLQQAGAPPFVVAAVAGLPGWIASGQVGPGARHGQFPEDALQDGALVDGRAAAGGRGGKWGDEGLDGLPLFVGEAHCGSPGLWIIDL